MVLSFKPQFKEKILSGSKIHTIREDAKNRWDSAKTIHFATGVRTKNYDNFKTEKRMSIQPVTIINRPYQMRGVIIHHNKCPNKEILLDRMQYFGKEQKNQKEIDDWLLKFANNDGFDSLEEFFQWFNKDFSGKIIHWTSHFYH